VTEEPTVPLTTADSRGITFSERIAHENPFDETPGDCWVIHAEAPGFVIDITIDIDAAEDWDADDPATRRKLDFARAVITARRHGWELGTIDTWEVAPDGTVTVHAAGPGCPACGAAPGEYRGATWKDLVLGAVLLLAGLFAVWAAGGGRFG
jgi:hypothetical protein